MLLPLPGSVGRTPLPDLPELGVCRLLLLVGQALVERLERRNQLGDCVGMRRGELCVPMEPVERVLAAALGPLLKQILHRLCVAKGVDCWKNGVVTGFLVDPVWTGQATAPIFNTLTFGPNA